MCQTTYYLLKFHDITMQWSRLGELRWWDKKLTKRLFDIGVAAIALVLLGPVIFISLMAIRLDSEGPGIFAQRRVGRLGREFTCFKLRTMCVDAENAATHLVSPKSLTRMGPFLRRYKIDELPQLWNVLIGEMSLVGPRPCLPTQTELITERFNRGVYDMLPGITGLAQVRGVDMSRPKMVATLDAQYVASQSLVLDVKLLLATLFGAGRGDPASSRNPTNPR